MTRKVARYVYPSVSSERELFRVHCLSVFIDFCVCNAHATSSRTIPTTAMISRTRCMRTKLMSWHLGKHAKPTLDGESSATTRNLILHHEASRLSIFSIVFSFSVQRRPENRRRDSFLRERTSTEAAAVRCDERSCVSRCRDHRVEPRPFKNAAKASVDAISDDERQQRQRSDTTTRELCYVAFAAPLESRVLDRSGGRGSYGVALKPTYRLFFLCRKPPVCGSVL